MPGAHTHPMNPDFVRYSIIFVSKENMKESRFDVRLYKSKPDSRASTVEFVQIYSEKI